MGHVNKKTVYISDDVHARLKKAVGKYNDKRKLGPYRVTIASLLEHLLDLQLKKEGL